MNLDIRMESIEPRQARNEPALRESRFAGNHQGNRNTRTQIITTITDLTEYIARRRKQAPPRFRKKNSSVSAFEQRQSQIVFKRPDLPAYRAVRNMQLVTSATEIQVACRDFKSSKR